MTCEGSLRRWCPHGPAGESVPEAGSFLEVTRALKKALAAGGSHLTGCVCVHLACIFHEETHNSRFSYVHTWRHITHVLGTLIACILTHITSRDPDMCTPLPSHLVTRFLENLPSPGTSCPLLLCPHPPPPPPTANPTPEKVQRRGPQGCTGNALHTTGQPGYFLSQSWRKVRPGAVSHNTVSCFLPLSLGLFLCLSKLQSVFLHLSVSHPVSVFLLQSSGSFGPNALCYLSLHDCLPTYPSKLSAVPPLPESFP